MKTNRGLTMLGVFLLLALASAPAMAQAPAAKQKQADKPVAAGSRTEPAAGPSGAMSEGIQVHGDWTIVIRNEDGSVAARHEFRNALVPNSSILPSLLSHQGSAGRWEVDLLGPASTEQPCGQGAGTPLPNLQPCVFIETADGGPAPPFAGMKVSVDNNTLLMVGSVRAVFQSHITSVVTLLNVCNPSQPPSLSCTTVGNLSGQFTARSLSALNILVQANQMIDVTVRISFS